MPYDRSLIGTVGPTRIAYHPTIWYNPGLVLQCCRCTLLYRPTSSFSLYLHLGSRCLSVCLSICLSSCLSVCLSVFYRRTIDNGRTLCWTELNKRYTCIFGILRALLASLKLINFTCGNLRPKFIIYAYHARGTRGGNLLLHLVEFSSIVRYLTSTDRTLKRVLFFYHRPTSSY